MDARELRLAPARPAVLERASATHGLLTQRTVKPARHVAANAPGDLLSLDTFYVGKLKGVGKVWQITGRDVASSFGRTRLIVGEVTAMAMLAFLREVVQPGYRRTGWRLTRVLTDKGKEFKGVFAAGCDRWQIRVTRTKPRHAWANGFVEPGRNVVNAAAHNGGQDYDSRVPLLLLGGAIRSGPLGRHNTCAQKQAIEQAISAAIQAVDCLINSC